MDEAGRLIREYHMLASSSVASRLDVLLDLVRIRDPQVMPFLLKVLGDRSESRESAHPCAEALRNGDGLVAPVERPQFAKAIGDVSADNSTTQLRVEAAPALGLFTEIDGVLTAFSTLALAREGVNRPPLRRVHIPRARRTCARIHFAHAADLRQRNAWQLCLDCSVGVARGVATLHAFASPVLSIARMLSRAC